METVKLSQESIDNINRTEKFIDKCIENGVSPLIKDLIDESWYEVFEQLLPELKTVFELLAKERKENKTIYPADINIFRAFKECKLTDLKCIWLLQDPYHDGSANGLATDNKIGKRLSPSLRNILNELLEDDVELDSTEGKTSHLEHLPSQGVLLLNTALTVEAGKPESHLEIWKPFTEKLLVLLSVHSHIVWCIWGAKAFAQINKIELRQEKQEYIISSHPSPLSVTKALGKYPSFKGSKPFSKVNAYLKEWGKTEIKW